MPLDHLAWVLEAHYLALACVNFICTQRIILSGGVMGQSQIFPLIWQSVQVLLNGYIQASGSATPSRADLPNANSHP